MKPKPDDSYSDEEAARRRDQALKRALSTPPKPIQPKPQKRRTKAGHRKGRP